MSDLKVILNRKYTRSLGVDGQANPEADPLLAPLVVDAVANGASAKGITLEDGTRAVCYEGIECIEVPLDLALYIAGADGTVKGDCIDHELCWGFVEVLSMSDPVPTYLPNYYDNEGEAWTWQSYLDTHQNVQPTIRDGRTFVPAASMAGNGIRLLGSEHLSILQGGGTVLHLDELPQETE